MQCQTSDAYKVWGADNALYGPVDLAGLKQWTQKSLVAPASWVHSQADGRWNRAAELDVLRECFVESLLGDGRWARPRTINLSELRQFPVFAGLSDQLLERFAAFGECAEALPGDVIIQKGDPCDAVYFVLSGMLRVRLMIGLGPDERTLCKVSGGEIFGEVGLFLNVTRTADVVAETDARLLRITENTFQLLVSQIPELTASIMFALAGTMARRIVDDNQRYYQEVTSQFMWR